MASAFKSLLSNCQYRAVSESKWRYCHHFANVLYNLSPSRFDLHALPRPMIREGSFPDAHAERQTRCVPWAQCQGKRTQFLPPIGTTRCNNCLPFCGLALRRLACGNYAQEETRRRECREAELVRAQLVLCTRRRLDSLPRRRLVLRVHVIFPLCW